MPIIIALKIIRTAVFIGIGIACYARLKSIDSKIKPKE